ncbi:MAG: prolyl oligopeptidase family serine peptidase [Oscillospiraceae bacterium]|nr:prolyl oligopeptidase family serine peptidase [Oscillospiraceae bacterium]
MKTVKYLFILILCLTVMCLAPVFASDIINARPTASAVLVNGEDTAFEAYNINGNNYFKLRDLAFVLSGTEKQFEVAYDAGINAVTLTSGESYTPDGGEMSGRAGGGEAVTALSATARVYLDGREINLEAYNIGGNNYFKLRDLGQALNFGVGWDRAANMIILNTNRNYWSFETSDITVNPGDKFELPGTLTMPEGGEGLLPLVIIVHGSGPGNRDGEVGEIKVYRDLAEQLAAFGVASIRYDKRTLTHNAEFISNVNFTVKEETVDDVIFAAELALGLEGIDKTKIYVAGHSLGGYLIPKIYAADTGNIIAGYISLAGSARSMTELLIEQIDYILSLMDISELLKTLEKQQIQAAVDAINALTESDRGSSSAVLGAYPSYWLDLADYDPVAGMKNVNAPLLFLQGGHDYQVTEIDFNMFKSALEDNADAQFILYPNLTHTFTFTEQFGTPDDYQTAVVVDTAVARDIAEFIKNNS